MLKLILLTVSFSKTVWLRLHVSAKLLDSEHIFFDSVENMPGVLLFFKL